MTHVYTLKSASVEHLFCNYVHVFLRVLVFSPYVYNIFMITL